MSTQVFFLLFIMLVVGRLHPVQGQDSIQNPNQEPQGGLAKLALVYYKINFTAEQRKILKDKELEFIFSVTGQGIPTLEKVNGVSDDGILDSLHRVTPRLPRFTPSSSGIDAGENSLYFFKMSFPTYQSRQPIDAAPMVFKQPSMEDIEYIHKSGQRIDMIFGGMANSFLGNPSRYLATGAGMKIDMLYMGKKGVGAGMMMSFYGNRLKQPYPIPSTRDQNPTPPTLLVGLSGNKVLWAQERKEFHLQFDLTTGVQNITPRLGDHDMDWVQLSAFSPGLGGDFLVKIGQDTPYLHYYSPSVVTYHLNFHEAVRPVFFNLRAATGVMVEAGISLRMVYHVVDEYRLKP